MSAAPTSTEELAQIIGTAPSSSALLETFTEIEGDISLRFTDTHLATDTEFLTTYFSAYFIVLLLEDQINEARMLMKRMPSSLTNAHPAMQSTLQLLRAAWNNNHAAVYQTIRQSEWPDALSGLVQSYESYFQNETFAKLGVSYETIRPSSVAYYLGIDSMAENLTPEAITTLTSKGWEWDSESNLFRPKASTAKPASVETEKIKIGELAALIGGHNTKVA